MGKKTAAAVLLSVAIFILSSCASEPPPSPVLIRPVIAEIRFDTETVTRGMVADITIREGVMRRDTHPLSFGPAAGFFYAYEVRLGDTVQEGQLLARLDFEIIAAQIERQEEHINRLRRSHDLANRLHLANLEILIAENDHINRRAGDESYIQRLQRESDIVLGWLELDFMKQRQYLDLRHEEGELSALRQRLEISELRAPFNGVVAYLVTRQKGAWVSPFEPMVYLIAEDALLFAEYIGAAVFIPALADRITAHVNRRIYNVTRLFITREQLLRYGRAPVRFTLDTENPPQPGSFVALHVYTNLMEDVLRIPRQALFYSFDSGFYVYRIENGQFTMTPVIVGTRSETNVAVLSGLEEGDEVYVRW